MAILKPSVLLIEDDAITAAIISQVLFDEGYNVKTADTLAAGWQLLMQQPENYELILLDRWLPEGDSLQTLAVWQQANQLWPIPLIMITAQTDENALIQSRELGITELLYKPIETDILIYTLHKVLKHNNI